MGAFENQIRENETFESLMDLYRKSINERSDLNDQATYREEIIADLAAELEKAQAQRDTLAAAAQAVIAVLMVDDQCEVLNRLYVALNNVNNRARGGDTR